MKTAKKFYPSIVQSVDQLPPGYVRASELAKSFPEHRRGKVQSALSTFVMNGEVRSFKLAPAPDAKPTCQSQWPLFVNEDEAMKRLGKVRHRPSGPLPQKPAAVEPEPASAAEQPTLDVSAFTKCVVALSDEIAHLREEMQLLRQSIAGMEQALLETATRPVEEVSA